MVLTTSTSKAVNRPFLSLLGIHTLPFSLRLRVCACVLGSPPSLGGFLWDRRQVVPHSTPAIDVVLLVLLLAVLLLAVLLPCRVVLYCAVYCSVKGLLRYAAALVEVGVGVGVSVGGVEG